MLNTQQSDHNINIICSAKIKDKEIELSDYLVNLFIEYDINYLLPNIELIFQLTSSQLKEFKLGKFSETYSITIETSPLTTQNINRYHLDLIPIEYEGLDLINISHTTESEKQPESITLTVRCLFNSALLTGHALSKVFENIEYKNIIKYVTDYIGYNVIQDDPEFIGRFEQFFLPYQKIMYALPFVLSYGYESAGFYTSYVAWDNLYILRSKKSKEKRGEVTVYIFDEKNYAQSTKTERRFKTAKISNSPNLKFTSGGTYTTFKVSDDYSQLKQKKFLAPYMDEKFDFVGNMDGLLTTPYTFSDKQCGAFKSSVLDIKERTHLLELSSPKIFDLEIMLPLYYQIKVEFLDPFLEEYTHPYFVIGSKLSLSRTKQVFTANLELFLIPDSSSHILESDPICKG